MKDHKHIHTNCQDLLSSLGEYIDGEASQELCAQIEQHMKGCQRCTVVVNTLRKTVELYRESAGETTLPVDVRQRLYAKLAIDNYLNK